MSTRVFTLTTLTLLAALALSDCRTAVRDQSRAPVKTPAAQTGQLAAASPESLRRAIEKVKSLHQPMGKPLPGDWLETFPEPGQTFDEYLKSNPTRPTAGRRTIYVQPLGQFTPAQSRVVALTAEYMSRFFNLPARLLDEKPLDNVPKSARRLSVWGDKQIQTGYITMNILRPSLPADAAALIALTSSDLFPDEKLNFVFGQASLSERVGVWSLYRLGDPGASDSDFKITLLRTLKIASHETGHMFSLPHCTAYECVMNGTNHLGETDRHPLDACPECTAKVCWATNTDPRERYARLAEFCASHGLTEEQRHLEDCARALDKD